MRLLSLSGLWALPFACAAFLAWQEWTFRSAQRLPAPVAVPLPASPALAPLNTAAVATVFGLAAPTALRPSAESLTLQATFAVDSGLSKALISVAQGARLYRVGDDLPGGSVLRRVEAQHVALWNKGREESLPLAPSASAFLKRLPASTEADPAGISARFLRPLAGQSE
ncbi:hypothetical protein PHLH6_04310 [Pseudomonas sp. Seg1]|uniref:type II secretion system protein N n=1 Tax=Pseudomonas sp. Seg1 TaxID=2678259 RepID=UPI001BF00871|nr:type II secretion system protein N [Pseudomonas sp. Seg1]BBP68427.1 hypothetical protein PHLH6_04310 [Pseudomonas sp. Seg1]